ncbi:transposase [Pseudoroseomonas wenyumeiae]|uniref:Transposase n=1 Tax=Teichococcus wenyumeiae TaxID=2478470 RepID=A0A3A9JQA5_9PROT|nr:DDE-type integrase/transposase/recombinase [Pseudoroseomonas wenyumeiae]RKK01139.1 transposase [Pseudoroseomonas wenyumeiae]RMI14749.1 transposase [Pseudoroseomonas wenyumeiae]
MRRVSMATRDELVAAVAARYAGAGRAERGLILDEFAAITGHHRKHAGRLLRRGLAPQERPRRARQIYDAAVREALTVLWEASDRICGKRLRVVLPGLVEAMERHGHLSLAPAVRTGLLAMSAATIDRALRDRREGGARRRRRRSPPSAAVRRSVPVRTSLDWGEPAPGYVEADLVAHSGPTARGSYVQTLVLTDIATGWTECAPLLVREQVLVREVLGEVRRMLPFPLLGFDTDNDSVFLNETVRDYCANTGVVFTRCRPYRKNDQAHVEQKNGAVVRRAVGYRRLEGLEAAAALAELYRSLRLFVNVFQPSFKLAEKTRDGAAVRKRYHAPQTPCARLLADGRIPEAVKTRVSAMAAALDPVRLLADIRAAQARLVEIADRPSSGRAAPPDVPTLEEFLAGLRTAWRAGEVRPTAKPKARKERYWRTRADPLEEVGPQLREWFRAEPWRTARELLERLQADVSGRYSETLLRTLQRRVKTWRAELAHQLVFGEGGAASAREQSDEATGA